MKKLVHVLFLVCYLFGVHSYVQSQREARIINGNIATADQFPFAAGILKSTQEGSYFCTGALISNAFVLTSGECVAGALSFTIHLGSNNLSDPNALKIHAEIYYLHPEYNATTLYNNIGIVKLPSPIISYTDYISPVFIVYDEIVPEYSAVTTLGWGLTSDSSTELEDTLNYVYLTVLDNYGCKFVYENLINDNMACLGVNSNSGTCWGDLGAPLILEEDSRAYLVAVASFIRPNRCESGEPSVFTWTAPYWSWIHDVISN